ncbi:MAG: hypothetical protein WDM71_03460 [Ferruginibacter sp.]
MNSAHRCMFITQKNITAQYKKLTDAFAQTDTRFFYACKALTNVQYLETCKKTLAQVLTAVRSMKLNWR